MIRGEVYRVRLPARRGREQPGRRYGVVVQAAQLLGLSIAIVAPTSRSAAPATFRPQIQLGGEPARVLVEQLRAMDIECLGELAGRARETPAAVRDTVAAVTQCILRVDDRSVRVTKAEGRDDGVVGTVLHWHEEDGNPVLEQANVAGRVAASLRSLRRARSLSQNDLAELAGVTSSAISQAERAERGLSLTTLVRLSTALGITIDDLLRGEDPELYRIGRRPEDPEHGLEHQITLLGSVDSELRVDFIQLAPRESGSPMVTQKGSGIVAVANGLVQVTVGGQAPAVRHGEVLVADSERVEQWRNVGHGEARLFWIVLSRVSTARPHRSVV